MLDIKISRGQTFCDCPWILPCQAYNIIEIIYRFLLMLSLSLLPPFPTLSLSFPSLSFLPPIFHPDVNSDPHRKGGEYTIVWHMLIITRIIITICTWNDIICIRHQHKHCLRPPPLPASPTTSLPLSLPDSLMHMWSYCNGEPSEVWTPCTLLTDSITHTFDTHMHTHTPLDWYWYWAHW